MMILARIVIGSAALLIVVAGIVGYGLYLFGESGQPKRTADKVRTPSSRPSPLPLAPQFAQRQRRRTLGLGLGAVAGGTIVVPETLESIRTGIPIHQLHGPAIDGWVALAAALFIIALGIGLIVANWRAPTHPIPPTEGA